MADRHKICYKCGKRRNGAGRYCKACHAAYMRQWRRGRVYVSRETFKNMKNEARLIMGVLDMFDIPEDEEDMI